MSALGPMRMVGSNEPSWSGRYVDGWWPHGTVTSTAVVVRCVTGRVSQTGVTSIDDEESVNYGRAVAELREDGLTRPLTRRLSESHPRYRQIMELHAAATAVGEPCYRDPSTGLSVMTASFLASRGYCCSSGCRHCPFEQGA